MTHGSISPAAWTNCSYVKKSKLPNAANKDALRISCADDLISRQLFDCTVIISFVTADLDDIKTLKLNTSIQVYDIGVVNHPSWAS